MVTYIEASGAKDGIITKSGRAISKPRPESVSLALLAKWRDVQDGITSDTTVKKTGSINLSLPYRNRENALRKLAAGIPAWAGPAIDIVEGDNRAHVALANGMWKCTVVHSDNTESQGEWDRTATKRKSKKGGDGLNLPSDVATTIRKTLDLMYPHVKGRNDSKAEVRAELLQKLGAALQELESAIAAGDMAKAAEIMGAVRDAKAELANV